MSQLLEVIECRLQPKSSFDLFSQAPNLSTQKSKLKNKAFTNYATKEVFALGLQILILTWLDDLSESQFPPLQNRYDPSHLRRAVWETMDRKCLVQCPRIIDAQWIAAIIIQFIRQVIWPIPFAPLLFYKMRTIKHSQKTIEGVNEETQIDTSGGSGPWQERHQRSWDSPEKICKILWLVISSLKREPHKSCQNYQQVVTSDWIFSARNNSWKLQFSWSRSDSGQSGQSRSS